MPWFHENLDCEDEDEGIDGIDGIDGDDDDDDNDVGDGADGADDGGDDDGFDGWRWRRGGLVGWWYLTYVILTTLFLILYILWKECSVIPTLVFNYRGSRENHIQMMFYLVWGPEFAKTCYWLKLRLQRLIPNT